MEAIMSFEFHSVLRLETHAKILVFHLLLLLRLSSHQVSQKGREPSCCDQLELLFFTCWGISKYWSDFANTHEWRQVRSRFCWKGGCKPRNLYQLSRFVVLLVYSRTLYYDLLFPRLMPKGHANEGTMKLPLPLLCVSWILSTDLESEGSKW